MATITNIVGAASTTDATSYTTASFTPQAGDYLVCNILSSNTLTTGTLTDTQNLGWTLLTSVNDGTNILVVFTAQRTASAVAMTVTWDCSADPATGARVGVLACRAADPIIRQFATATGAAATTPAVTLPGAVLTTNAAFGQVGNNSNPAAISPTVTPVWTEIADAGWATPTTGFELQRIFSGETNTTITWGSTSATGWMAFVFEVWNVGDAPGAKQYNYVDGYYGMMI